MLSLLTIAKKIIAAVILGVIPDQGCIQYFMKNVDTCLDAVSVYHCLEDHSCCWNP